MKNKILIWLIIMILLVSSIRALIEEKGIFENKEKKEKEFSIGNNRIVLQEGSKAEVITKNGLIQIKLIGSGNIYSKDIPLENIKDAEIEILNDIIQKAKFTATKEQRYKFNYLGDTITIDAITDSLVNYDPTKKDKQFSGTNLKEINYKNSYIKPKEGLTEINFDETKKEIKDLSLLPNSKYEDKESGLEYSSEKPFKFYNYEKDLSEEENAISIIQKEGKKQVNAKGFIAIKNKNGINYEGKGEDSYLRYRTWDNAFDVSGKNFILNNGKHGILGVNGAILLATPKDIWEVENLESFKVRYENEKGDIYYHNIDEESGSLTSFKEGHENQASIYNFKDFEEVFGTKQINYNEELNRIKSLIEEKEKKNEDITDLKKQEIALLLLSSQETSKKEGEENQYEALEHAKDAQKAYESLRIKDPELAQEIYKTLANAYSKVGNFKEAKNYFERAFNENPNNDIGKATKYWVDRYEALEALEQAGVNINLLLAQELMRASPRTIFDKKAFKEQSERWKEAFDALEKGNYKEFRQIYYDITATAISQGFSTAHPLNMLSAALGIDEKERRRAQIAYKGFIEAQEKAKELIETGRAKNLEEATKIIERIAAGKGYKEGEILVRKEKILKEDAPQYIKDLPPYDPEREKYLEEKEVGEYRIINKQIKNGEWVYTVNDQKGNQYEIEEGKIGPIYEPIRGLLKEEKEISRSAYLQLANEPTIKSYLEISKTEKPISESNKLTIAKQLEKEGNYLAAISLLERLSISKDPKIREEANKRIIDIQGYGGGSLAGDIFNIASETKKGIPRMAIELVNPAVFGALGKASTLLKRILAKSPTGMKFLGKIEETRNIFGKNWFVQTALEEGFEEAAGHIHPSLEFVAMFLTGGEIEKQNAIKNAKVTPTTMTIGDSLKLEYDAGIGSQAHKDLINNLKKIGSVEDLGKGVLKVVDKEGRSIILAPKGHVIKGEESLLDINQAIENRISQATKNTPRDFPKEHPQITEQRLEELFGETKETFGKGKPFGFIPGKKYGAPEFKPEITAEAVDLNKLPMGTLIEVQGEHMLANYLIKIEPERKISIWGYNQRANARIIEIDSLLTIKSRQEFMERILHRGILVKGRSTGFPYFEYESKKGLESVSEVTPGDNWFDAPQIIRVQLPEGITSTEGIIGKSPIVQTQIKKSFEESKFLDTPTLIPPWKKLKSEVGGTTFEQTQTTIEATKTSLIKPKGQWLEDKSGNKIFITEEKRDLPLGFRSETDWKVYKEEKAKKVRELRSKLDIKDIKVSIFGSSATGVSSKTGEFVDKPHDLDFGFVSNDLFDIYIERAYELAREGNLLKDVPIENQISYVKNFHDRGVALYVPKLLPEITKQDLAGKAISPGTNINILIAREGADMVKGYNIPLIE